ncbi:hypothetical protein RI367_008115 [Sorochytrium milnesiophthora]
MSTLPQLPQLSSLLSKLPAWRPRLSSVVGMLASSSNAPAADSSSSSSSTPTSDSKPAASPDNSPTPYIVAPNYHAPRAPILLCHGLFGFDKLGPDALPWAQVHYWRGITDALQKLGAKVVVAKVPRTGNVHQRALELHRILNQRQLKHVNLIAHSMGGLDCRYLIDRLPPSSTQVLSLTTVSTPHRGSPFMDWCADIFGVGKLIQAMDAAAVAHGVLPPQSRTRSLQGEPDHGADSTMVCSAAIHEAISRNAAPPSQQRDHEAFNQRPESAYSASQLLQMLHRVTGLLDTPAYANLTTHFCKEVFNTQVHNDPQVEYLSYGAHYDIPFWAPLRIPYEIIQRREGPNDGLVSVESAKWGQYMGTLPTDHWGLNNRWLSSKINKKFDALEFYVHHATQLWRKGY